MASLDSDTIYAEEIVRDTSLINMPYEEMSL